MGKNYDEMSDKFKEVKGYGTGPVLIHSDELPGEGKTVALVSAQRGGAWVPRQCNNLQQYGIKKIRKLRN